MSPSGKLLAHQLTPPSWLSEMPRQALPRYDRLLSISVPSVSSTTCRSRAKAQHRRWHRHDRRDPSCDLRRLVAFLAGAENIGLTYAACTQKRCSKTKCAKTMLVIRFDTQPQRRRGAENG